MHCCVEKALLEGLEKAQAHGNTIKHVVLKVSLTKLHIQISIFCISQTDRPTSEYWNSGMVQSLRDLSIKYQIAISHFTEQSHYNKDRVDGEFSIYKDALTIHLQRHNAEDPAHFEVVDSETFARFGEKYLAKPGPKSAIEKRMFFDLKAEVMRERIAEKPSFKTLTGIKSVFQYICKNNGEVVWRRLTCFCVKCLNLEWDHCYNKDIVGKLKIVIQEGVEF